MYNDTTTNTFGGHSGRSTARTKADGIRQMEVPRVRHKDDDAGGVEVSSNMHQSRKAPKEIDNDGD
jgi:hypothetical protein